MKFKTTKKAILNSGIPVYGVPYCALQFLLALESPVAYTVRREGWGADVYEVNGVYIVTGYAPFGKRIPYDLYTRYEKSAGVFRRLDYPIRKARNQELIAEMISAVEYNKESNR